MLSVVPTGAADTTTVTAKQRLEFLDEELCMSPTKRLPVLALKR